MYTVWGGGRSGISEFWMLGLEPPTMVESLLELLTRQRCSLLVLHLIVVAISCLNAFS